MTAFGLICGLIVAGLAMAAVAGVLGAIFSDPTFKDEEDDE